MYENLFKATIKTLEHCLTTLLQYLYYIAGFEQLFVETVFYVMVEQLLHRIFSL